MNQMSTQEFMKKYDESVWPAIVKAARATKAEYLVNFECVDMWSSHLGERTCLCVGPSCTYKTVEECEGGHLGDLPSERKYPREYCSVEELERDIAKGVEMFQKIMSDTHKGE